MRLGTVLNCNSKSSRGDTESGRPRTSRTPANIGRVKAVMDRDAPEVNILAKHSAHFSSFSVMLQEIAVLPVTEAKLLEFLVSDEANFQLKPCQQPEHQEV